MYTDRLLTGFYGLDMATLGLEFGTLMMVTGKASTGKSCFVDQIARFVLLGDKSVAVFSLEESRSSRLAKLLSSQSKIDNYSFRAGSLAREDWVELGRTVDKFTTFKLFVEDSKYLLAEVKEICFDIQEKVGLDLIVIDSVQLIKNDSPPYGYRLLADLKRFARQINAVVVFTGYQDLKFSIEQYPEVDVILSLNEENQDSGRMIIGNLEKIRNGMPLAFSMSFDVDSLCFNELGEKKHQEEINKAWKGKHFRELAEIISMMGRGFPRTSSDNLSQDKTVSIFKSPQEEIFFEAAQEFFKGKKVFPNVAVSCLINFDAIKHFLPREEISYFFKAIVDCVVFDSENKPEHLFELDSSYHDSSKQQLKDLYKDNIFKLAGRQVHRIRVNPQLATKEEFISLIKSIIGNEVKEDSIL